MANGCHCPKCGRDDMVTAEQDESMCGLYRMRCGRCGIVAYVASPAQFVECNMGRYVPGEGAGTLSHGKSKKPRCPKCGRGDSITVCPDTLKGYRMVRCRWCGFRAGVKNVEDFSNIQIPERPNGWRAQGGEPDTKT